ncbi:MAG: potassium channel family protein [Verrucomicrobiota bacterium]
MAFTIVFLKFFFLALFYASPVLVFLALSIAGLGFWIGKREGWSFSDSLYYAFITATTVGYGDFHPRHMPCKFLAILIAIIGVLFTGIIVASGLYAIETAFTEVRGIAQ